MKILFCRNCAEEFALPAGQRMPPACPVCAAKFPGNLTMQDPVIFNLLDRGGVTDGVIREMARKGDYKQLKEAIKEGMHRRNKALKALEELATLIHQREGEST